MNTESVAIILELVIGLSLPPIGLLAWRKNPINLVLQVFLGTCLTLFFWIFFQGLNRLVIHYALFITDFFFQISEVFLIGSGILVLYFGNVFPGRTRRRRGRRRKKAQGGYDPRRRFNLLFWPLVGIGVVLALLSFTDLYVAGRVYNQIDGTYAGESGIVYYANRLFAFLCILLAIREQQRFLNAQERDRPARNSECLRGRARARIES